MAGVVAPGVERRGIARSDPELRLVALARGDVALRRALARVAGRWVALRGWERLGFARLDDYAAERAGVSGRELRDLAAVDRALAELRGLEQAYLAGRLGWTQLRLLCRVATPADQQRWLALASQLTAGELAREVRAVDRRARARCGAGPEEERGDQRVGVVLRVSRQAHARWWSARGLAARVTGQALSHARFAELLAAEVASAVPLEDGEEVGAEAATRGSCEREVQRRVPLPIFSPPAREPEVEALGRDLDAADAFELDARLRRGLALEARHQARVAAALREVAGLRLYRDVGFTSVDAYAEERLGISRRLARELLRVERAGRECPALGVAFRSGRLGWVRVSALLALGREPAAVARLDGWVAHAQRVSVRRLREDVDRALASGEFAVPALEPRGDGCPGGVQTGANARSVAEDARVFFSAEPEVAGLFRAVLAAVQRRLERLWRRPATRSAALGAMLEHAVAAWQPEHAPPREHAIFERDGWRCAAPGCSAYRNLQRHHVVFRSQGGGDEPANLTTLCAWHHLRGIHAGRLRCTGRAPDGLRFELGLRAGREPLAVYGPGEVRMSP